jgi:hypothetical protein
MRRGHRVSSRENLSQLDGWVRRDPASRCRSSTFPANPSKVPDDGRRLRKGHRVSSRENLSQLDAAAGSRNVPLRPLFGGEGPPSRPRGSALAFLSLAAEAQLNTQLKNKWKTLRDRSDRPRGTPLPPLASLRQARTRGSAGGHGRRKLLVMASPFPAFARCPLSRARSLPFLARRMAQRPDVTSAQRHLLLRRRLQHRESAKTPPSLAGGGGCHSEKATNASRNTLTLLAQIIAPDASAGFRGLHLRFPQQLPQWTARARGPTSSSSRSATGPGPSDDPTRAHGLTNTSGHTRRQRAPRSISAGAAGRRGPTASGTHDRAATNASGPLQRQLAPTSTRAPINRGAAPSLGLRRRR